MNHFEFTGPAFLLFYLIFSSLVVVSLFLARRMAESSGAPKIDLRDPYLVAYLRGGEPETLRVAVVSLIERGLLIATGTRLKRAEHATPSSVRVPIEAWLLRKFEQENEVSSMYNDPTLHATCLVYEETLKNAGLLPNKQIYRARAVRFVFACLLLMAVAFLKVILAIDSGHTNVGYLIILMVVAMLVANKVSFPRLTESGKAMIADLQNLYSGLKDRAPFMQPRGATIEPMMLAAVFGVGAIESANFAFPRELFPRGTKDQSGSSCASASCGTSCSSGGSSCGSGCGGGCGGCGGS